MKVLLINDNSIEKGGAEVSVFGTRRLLSELGHEVYFFGFGDGRLDNSFILGHKKNKFLYFLEKFFFSYRIYKKLKKYIFSINPDIIHLHNNYLYSLSILYALKHSKVPVVHTVHDWGLLCPSSWGVYRYSLKPCTLAKGIATKCYFHEGCLNFGHFTVAYFRNKLRFRLEKKVMRRFLPPSAALTTDLKKFGFDPVNCLHHFIEFSHIKLSERSDNILLYVGALSKNKGVHYLIEAMPFILKETPNAKLRIIGDGPELNNLRRLAENEKQIEFTGRVPHEKVIEEYKKANILVIPSIWSENSPFVLYEALLTSLPVVGTKRGGIPDLVTDNVNGFLVEAGNSKSLAEKITKLLKDKALQEKFSKNCKAILESKFSTQKYLKTLLESYENSIKKANGHVADTTL